jgi:hypothetical protein
VLSTAERISSFSSTDPIRYMNTSREVLYTTTWDSNMIISDVERLVLSNNCFSNVFWFASRDGSGRLGREGRCHSIFRLVFCLRNLGLGSLLYYLLLCVAF